MRNLVMVLVMVIVGGIAKAQTMGQKNLMIAYQQHIASQHLTKAYIAATLGIAGPVFNKQITNDLANLANNLNALKANCTNTKVKALLNSFEASLNTQKELVAIKKPSSKDLEDLLINTEGLTAVTGHIVEILKRENKVALNAVEQEWELIYKLYDNAFLVEKIATKYMVAGWNLSTTSNIEISNIILKEEVLLGELVEMTDGNEKANAGVMSILYKWAEVEKYCTALNSDKNHKSMSVGNQVLGNSELVLLETENIVNTILNTPIAITSDQGN